MGAGSMRAVPGCRLAVRRGRCDGSQRNTTAVKAWIRFVDWQRPSAAAVQASLQAAGVSLRAVNPSQSTHLPGVLLVSPPADRIERELRAVLQGDCERVIVMTEAG